MAPIAKVEPLTSARLLRGPFDYRLPAAMGPVEVGSLLVVPFGRRRVLGVVVDLADHTDIDPAKLAAPISALEQGVPPDLVSLATWMAAAYCSTPARALGLVLPPGVSPGGTEKPRLQAKRRLVAERTGAGAGDGCRLTAGQRSVLQMLAAGPVAAADLPLDHGGLRRLEDRGLISLVRTEVRRRPTAAVVGAASVTAPPLTAHQAAAAQRIEAAMASGEAAQLLLHGVTGSGKTEVYLAAASAALQRGRGAIVLVPEIALTPQAVTRFQARFGDTVAVLHSQLGAGERYDEWRRLRRGDARICVGPRSAVFAPVSDLGLIVVDEEHDASYKHEGDPRYDARTVASRRARQAGAVLVAGSATPRPESVQRLERLRLPERVDGRPLPPVRVLDMRDAAHALHPATREALDRVRRAHEKAIILLNRRGWANFLSCRSCGRVWECPQCDVALVLHQAAGEVACHHCGHHEPVPSRCPSCASLAVARHGAGTERLERELDAALGTEHFPIFRLDSDTATGRGRVAEVLGAFERAPAGILLGTQVVAKGHDFPDVTLGVVLDADATLRFPDFRAEERTFALIAQLAGRAGRGPKGGRVLVQSLDPDALSIRHAAQHDADGYLAGELARREALRYPPFAELIRIVCTSEQPGAAAAAVGAVADRIRASGPPAPAVLGPAPLFRLRGRERAQVVVKAGDPPAAVRAVGAAVEAAAGDKANRHATFSVDVDPQ